MPQPGQKSEVLIALAGESGAGKSTSAKLLKEMGFHLIELTKQLRSDAENLMGSPTRAQIQRYARDMQGKHGNDYYARLALSGFGQHEGGDIVLDGIRNPAELGFVTEFAQRTSRAFCLLALVTPTETRFERVKGRRREGDPTEYAHFREDDRRALGDGDVGFQTNAFLIAAANRHIENTGNKTDLRKAISEAVRELRESE